MNKLLTVVCLAATASFAAAQWTPVTAGIRETTEIVNNGVVTSTNVREGVFLRKSDGSTLTKFTKMNGTVVPGNGNLIDNVGLRSYRIDYKSMSARPSSYVPVSPLQPNVYANITTVGQGTSGGQNCRLIPIIMDSPIAASQRIGEQCVLDSQSLVLKDETRVTKNDGSIAHVTTELFNINLNTAPNDSDFDLTQFAVASVVASPAPDPMAKP